jgi:hypothetical protein
MPLLTIKEINNIKNEIELTNSKIYKMQQEIKNLNKHLNNYYNILKNGCDHNKVINHTMTDERTQYYCTICDIDL